MTETSAAGAVAPESVVIEVEIGADGRLPIPQEIRERIGIEPGWIARQRVVGAHVEILFIPPDPGRLRSDVAVSPEEWGEARERAWAEAAEDDWEPHATA